MINGIVNFIGIWVKGLDMLILLSMFGVCVGVHIIGYGIFGGVVINGINGFIVMLNFCGVGLWCVENVLGGKSFLIY